MNLKVKWKWSFCWLKMVDLRSFGIQDGNMGPCRPYDGRSLWGSGWQEWDLEHVMMAGACGSYGREEQGAGEGV